MIIGFQIFTRKMPTGDWQPTAFAFLPSEEEKAKEQLQDLQENTTIWRQFALVSTKDYVITESKDKD